MKKEYIDDENYEESPYYWKTPDNWLYLHDPNKNKHDSYSISIKTSKQLITYDDVIDANSDIIAFKNECIKDTSQINLRIGINDLMIVYKKWCELKNINILNRKTFKNELSKINIKEKESKGVDIKWKIR